MPGLPSHGILAGMRVTARCLGGTAAAGALVAVAVGLLPRRWRRMAVLVVTAAVVPGAVAALWPAAVLAPLPGAWAAGEPAPHWRLVPAALPLLLLFPLDRLARLPPGLDRAATGLGAGIRERIRLIWLPQLGPSALLGLGAGTALDLLALVLRS